MATPSKHAESSSGIATNPKNRKEKDLGWKYNYVQDLKDPNSVTCLLCTKVTKGGIRRAKMHQIGRYKDAARCLKCPTDVREELKTYVERKKQNKANYEMPPDFEDLDNQVEIENSNEEEHTMYPRGRRMETQLVQLKGGKRPKLKGAMDVFVHCKPEVVVQMKKEAKLRQTKVSETYDKEKREMTCQYQAGIPFNVARMDCFKWMIEAVGQYGPDMNPPSYHELRVPILKKEVEYTHDLLKNHKSLWVKHGCSIMSDGLTSRTNRSLINFLINSPAGTMFLKSIDASAYVKTAKKIFKLLDEFVDYVGKDNVVQVVTNNGANFKAAGRLLEAKRPHIYWTPCATHCLDLILEDIGKIDKVAINMTGYIYNHVGVLNMMRHFTNQRELIRPGKTRFYTSYLTLKSIHEQKNPLRTMFTSQDWTSSKWAKEAKRKCVVETVYMGSFWNNVVYILKVMGPLVRMLRLVDNEKKPAMGYIYEAMDRAKEVIQKAFNENEAKYRDIFQIIDERWNCQLHQDLHAAGHFLNP